MIIKILFAALILKLALAMQMRYNVYSLLIAPQRSDVFHWAKTMFPLRFFFNAQIENVHDNNGMHLLLVLKFKHYICSIIN